MWNDLNMQQKADIISMAVKAGVRDIDSIKSFYEDSIEYGRGGYLEIAKSNIRKNEGWTSRPMADGPKGTGWRSVGYGFNDSGFRTKYPQGISKFYEKGITKAQAEQELDYIIRRIDSHLKSVYGSKWNNFTDNQKAAIMDTYYQRPASVVGRKSDFYHAIMRGDKNAVNYLGVKGYSSRNKKRRALFGNSKNVEVEEPTVIITPSSQLTEESSFNSLLPTNVGEPEIEVPDILSEEKTNNLIELVESLKGGRPTQEEKNLSLPTFSQKTTIPQVTNFMSPILNRRPISKVWQQPIVPMYKSPYSIYDLYDNFYNKLGIPLS